MQAICRFQFEIANFNLLGDLLSMRTALQAQSEVGKLESQPRKRLLLLDIDGTLIHSGGAGVHAFRLTLAERFDITDALHDLEMAGMTDSGIVVSSLKKHHIPG